MNGKFNTTAYPPRILGGLESNKSCSLFGWRAQEEVIRWDRVDIYDSTYCDPNSPQVFCSKFASPSHTTCTANPGAPVMCDDFSIIAGILIASNRSCITNGDQSELNFHSIEPFIEWIEVVSSAVTKKISVFLILSAFLSVVYHFH